MKRTVHHRRWRRRARRQGSHRCGPASWTGVLKCAGIGAQVPSEQVLKCRRNRCSSPVGTGAQVPPEYARWFAHSPCPRDSSPFSMSPRAFLECRLFLRAQRRPLHDLSMASTASALRFAASAACRALSTNAIRERALERFGGGGAAFRAVAPSSFRAAAEEPISPN
jgi:hypothetical protein